ncbi:tyrosine-type recombinase/integrase [Gallibacterium sp. AGMB14963]|uniref:tyrosine-type recombinase/integrase n=1 Tax=Gallibacterium faecale TaxID=3019086 RepID=UPI0022F1BEF7|nr:site-specific integrase [Gallibacterium sp. AGMB14963]MDA3977826.1 site-specific integrase [Gallibacterium sp. AGMB14963]
MTLQSSFYDGLSFDDLLEKFLIIKYLRPETKKSYRKMVSLFTRAYPGILADEITKELVCNWRNEQLCKLRETSVNSYLRNCKAVINWGIENHFINRKDNPFTGTFVKEPRKQRKIIKEQDIQALTKYITQEDIEKLCDNGYCTIVFAQALIFTLLYTGMRRSQLLKLKINNIDLSNKTIFIPHYINKNNDDHMIPISSKLYPYIAVLINELKVRKVPNNSQLFNINIFSSTTRRRDGNMTNDQLAHFFRKLSKITKIKLSPHRFRHTIATQLMKSPEQNLYATQKLLGHRDIKTTLSYIEFDVDMLRKIVDSI